MSNFHDQMDKGKLPNEAMTAPTDAELANPLLPPDPDVYLRILADCLEQDGDGDWGNDPNTVRAIADRLTALSEEVERLREAAKWEPVEAENRRLREALGIYAAEKNWHCTEFGEYHEHGEACCKDGWWVIGGNGFDIARTALQENTDGK